MNNFKLDNGIKISSGFVTPDNYFETFPDKVLLKTREQQISVISLFSRRRKIIYAAAAIVVMALSISFFNQQPEDTELDDATIENYLAYNANITQYDLLTVLESDDIQQLATEYALDDEVLEDALVSGQNLEQFIIE